jgi:hypothetical protein
MKVEDYINGNVTYDKDGQYFWIHGKSNGIKMLAELRGWGHIQNIFARNSKKCDIDMDAAAKFQDEVGEWIADAINAKIKLVEI